MAARRGRTAGNTTSGNGFRTRFTGPPAHAEAVRRARDEERIAARRAKAWRLFAVEELTFDQIGKRLNVSGKTAFYDVQAVRRARKDAGLLDADFLADRQQATIRTVIRTHLPKRDRVESARVILQALEREARLNGLDRQREAGYTAEQVVALAKALAADLLAAFPATEERRRIADVFRRRMGEGAIEAEPAERKEIAG